MKTITINVYSFDELTDKAKEKARDEYRNKRYNYSYSGSEENYDSLKAFCEYFEVNIKDYSISPYSYSYVNTDVKNQNFRGLKLNQVNPDYMPTGYSMDYPLWATFYNVFKETSNALQAFNDAVDQWIKDVNSDYEYQDSDEYIDEIMTINDYEFDENGVIL